MKKRPFKLVLFVLVAGLSMLYADALRPKIYIADAETGRRYAWYYANRNGSWLTLYNTVDGVAMRAIYQCAGDRIFAEYQDTPEIYDELQFVVGEDCQLIFQVDDFDDGWDGKAVDLDELCGAGREISITVKKMVYQGHPPSPLVVANFTALRLPNGKHSLRFVAPPLQTKPRFRLVQGFAGGFGRGMGVRVLSSFVLGPLHA